MGTFRRRVALARRRLLTHGFHWHFSDGASKREISEARRRMRAAVHRKWPVLLRPLAWLLAIPAWSWQCYREAGVVAEMSDTQARPDNFRRGAVLAGLRYNVSPSEYGSYGLWRDGSAPADSWIYNTESMTVTADLTDKAVRNLTGDKAVFAEFCQDHGELPVAKTLAVYRDGRCIQAFANDAPPESELVSKPVRAAHATGFQVWHPENGSLRCVSDPSGPVLPLSEFSSFLADLSQQYTHGVLVQPFLHAHPDLTHLGVPGPPVARIITGRWKDGRTEVLDAILQKPPPGAYLMTGGSMRLIDIETGKSRSIHRRAHLFPDSTADPAFDGLMLPDWDTCCVGLNRLHAKMPAQAPLLGWDVIFAAKGPTILEANTTLSAYAFQVAGQEPVAKGRWLKLLAEYLQ